MNGPVLINGSIGHQSIAHEDRIPFFTCVPIKGSGSSQRLPVLLMDLMGIAASHILGRRNFHPLLHKGFHLHLRPRQLVFKHRRILRITCLFITGKKKGE